MLDARLPVECDAEFLAAARALLKAGWEGGDEPGISSDGGRDLPTCKSNAGARQRTGSSGTAFTHSSVREAGPEDFHSHLHANVRAARHDLEQAWVGNVQEVCLRKADSDAEELLSIERNA